MVATNTMEKDMNLETSRFYERMKGFTNSHDVMTGETISSLSLLKLPAKTAIVLELIK